MTHEQFEKLHRGQILYHVTNRNADGTAQRWKVNGKMHGSGDDARWPVKHGLRGYGYLTTHKMHLLVLEDPTAGRSIKVVRIRVDKLGSGSCEYKVPGKTGKEESAYYTDNKEDAVGTAKCIHGADIVVKFWNKKN